MNYSGAPLTAGLVATTRVFYAGDQIKLAYTTNNAKPLVALEIIHTALVIGITITDATTKSYEISGVIGATGLALFEAGYIDATALATPFNRVTVALTCIPAAAPTSLAITSTGNTTVSGQNVTFTANASSIGGTPTGNVVFSIGGVQQPAVALNSGVATFSTSSLPVASYAVSASFLGSTNFAGSGATLAGGHRVNLAPTTTTVSSTPRPSAYGQAVTLTAQVSPNAPGAGTPSGNVIFAIDGVDQPAVALSGGSASMVTTSMIAGARDITTRYQGDARYGSSTATLPAKHTVIAAATNISLTVAPSPSTFGQGVVATATVLATGVPVVGNVVFTVDNVARAPVALSGGTATFNDSSLSVGSHTISADYYGTNNFLVSSSPPRPHTVTRASTTTTVSGPGSIVYGQSATFTANVSSTGGTPTGTVTFVIDTVPQTPVALSGGRASFTASGLVGGTRVIEARYNGSTSFDESTGDLTGGQAVSPSSTSTILKLPVGPSHFGETIAVSAEVSSLAGTPDGVVTFVLNGVPQPPASVINGIARIALSGLAATTHSISAHYDGTASFATSTTASANHIVSPATTTTLVRATPEPSVSGQSVTFTARVTSDGGVPDGSVEFSVGGQAVTPRVALVNGEASLSRSDLGVGNHAVSATYMGNVSFVGSTGALPGGQTVGKAATKTTIVSSANPASFGAPITLTAAIEALPPSLGTPTGEVVFSIDGVPQASRPVVDGIATLTAPSLAVGSYSITAVYGGDPLFGQSSDTLSGKQDVVKAATDAAIAVTPGRSKFGDTLTLHAEIISPGGTPAGAVQFSVDGAPLADVGLHAGKAEFTVSGFTTGTHEFRVSYSGSPNFEPSADATSTHQVDPATVTLEVNVSQAQIRFGDIPTLTIEAKSSAGQPDGTVDIVIDGTVVASGILLVNGKTTYSPSGLDVGTHVVEVLYSGSGSFAPTSRSLTGGLHVDHALVGMSLSATAPAIFGQPIVVSAVLTSGGGDPPGDIVFTINGQQHSAPIAGNGANLPVSGLEPGFYTVTATYDGTTEFAGASAALNGGLTIQRAPSGVVVDGPSSASTFGDNLTFEATVSSSPAPTGTVTFWLDNVAQPPVPLSGGKARLSLTDLSAGPHSLSADYSGDSHVLPSNGTLINGHVVGVALTTMVLTADPGTIEFGQTVELLAKVNTSAGTPTGNVDFTVDGTAYQVALNNGEARLTISSLVVGSHSASASYAPQGNHDASSHTLPTDITVIARPTSIAVSGPTGPVRLGETATFTADLTNGAAKPTGTVNFVIDGNSAGPITRPLVDGIAKLDHVFLTGGNHSITVIYGGSNEFAASDGQLVGGQVIDPAISNTVLAASVPSIHFGDTMSATATVTNGTTPTGIVEFLRDSIVVGSAGLVSGKAVFEFANLSGGEHNLSARYLGSLDHAPSTGELLGYLVEPALTTAALTVNPTIIVVGEPVSFGVTVAATHGPAKGDVVFTIDSGDPSTVTLDASGKATYVTTFSSAGTYTIGASFAGSADFAAVTPASQTLTVDPAPLAVTLVSHVPNGVLNESYSGSVTPVGGVGSYTLTQTGDLPPGLQFLPNGAITGTPNTAGTFTFLVQAVSGGVPVSQSYSITIVVPVIVSVDTDLAEATAGEAYFSPPLTASGGSSSYTFTTSGVLRSGIAYDPDTNRIEGTSLQVGTFPFDVIATDTNGISGRKTFQFKIVAPTIEVRGTLPDGEVGIAYPASNIAAAGGTSPYTYAVGVDPLPPGLVLDTITGAISGKPTSVGTYAVRLVATDKNGFTGALVHTFSTVLAPILSMPSTLPDPRQGRPYAQSVAANGTPPHTYAVTGGALPDGLVLNPSTGIISGTPTVPGLSDFEITATDSSAPTRLVGVKAYQVTTAPKSLLTMSPPPDLVAGEPGYLHAFAAQGGNSPYRYAIISGNLPNDLEWDSAAGVISGSTIDVGRFNFVVEVTDALGDTWSQGIVLEVNAPMIVITPPSPDGTAGILYSGTTTALGGQGAHEFSSANLPSWLTLDIDGTLSGTPRSAGPVSFDIEARDANGFVGTVKVALNISPPSIVLDPLSLTSHLTTRPYSATITASGGNSADDFSHAGGVLPPGLTLSSSGVIDGTPTLAGTFTFEITVKDNDNFTASRTYTIVITDYEGTATLRLGLPGWIAGERQTAFTDVTNDPGPFTYAVIGGALPAPLTLDKDTGEISGETAAVGSHTFTIEATKTATGQANQRTYVLSVAPPVHQAIGTLPAGIAGTPYPSQTVSASGGAGPYSFGAATGLPPLLTFDAATGILSGTPTEAGSFTIAIPVTDINRFTGTLIYPLTITAPSITLTGGTLPDGMMMVPYSHYQISAGGNGAGTISYAVTAGVMPAGLNLAADGTLSGTPTMHGVYSFEVTASDIHGFTGSALYALKVDTNVGTVELPDSLPDWTFRNTGTRSVIALSGATGTTQYWIAPGALPAGLQFDQTTNDIRGAPTAVGDFSFVVTATDGPLISSQVVSLRILAPVLSFTGSFPTTGRVGESYSGDVDATSTGPSSSLSYAIDTPPPGLSIDSHGTLSGTPTASGTFSFTVTATDADGYFVRQSHVVTIAPALFALTLPATLPSGTENMPYSGSFAPTNGVGPYRYTITGALPLNLIADSNLGLSGTPVAAGSFPILVSVTDAADNSGSANYTLVINPVVVTAPISTVTSLSVPPALVGQTITLSASVVPVSGTAYGTVTFTDSVGGALGTAILDGAGVAQLTVAFSDTQTRTISAQFDGNSTFASSNSPPITFNPGAATTAIDFSSAATTVIHGDPSVIVATVRRTAPAAGTPGPGTIRFLLGGVQILAESTAHGALTLAQVLPPGEHTLRVAYEPDAPASDLPIEDDLKLTIEADTIVGIAGNSESVEGEQTTFTASVDTIPSHPGYPSGSVEFMAGTTLLSSQALQDGKASLTTDTLGQGHHDIWVNYPGDGVFRAGASSPLPHVVSIVPDTTQATAISVEISTTTPAVSENVTMSAKVATEAGFVPTGQVEFFDTASGIVFGMDFLDGSGRATLDHVFTDIAPRRVEARYLGAPGFVSTTASIAVAPVSARTTLALSLSQPSSLAGDTLTLTASVTRSAPASGTPSSGIVEFLADGTVLGQVSTDGSDSATFTTLPLFADAVFSARYKGPLDQTDAPSASPEISHKVTRDDISLGFDVTSDGTSIFIDATLTPSKSTTRQPSGTLVLRSLEGLFQDQALPIMPGATRFQVPAASFTSGLHVLTVSYDGDLFFNPAAGQVSHQVTGDTTVSLSMSPLHPTPGRPVALSARVLSAQGGTMPTGNVQFRFVSATWSHELSANLVEGLASTSMVFLDGTEGEMIVIYSGDGLYQSTAATPLRRRITMTPELAATTTALSSSKPAVAVGQPVTFSAQVGAASGAPGGTVVFYDGEILLGSAPVADGTATYTVAGFASGTHPIVAYYGGTPLHAASRSDPFDQRVLGADAVTFSMHTRPSAYVALGQKIEVAYRLAATGGIELSGIGMQGGGMPVSCPQTTLGANLSMECVATYVITEADMAAGRVDLPGTVTIDGIGAIVSGTSITLQAAAVAEQFRTMTESFITTRQKLMSSSLRLPDIFDRLRQAPGRRPGTVVARADGMSQVLGFSSSLAEVMSWGAAQAAENLATSIALEPLPINIWIDGQMTLHARDEDTAQWGDFSTLALGADYLLADTALIGAVWQGDWMHDFSAKGEVSGSGYLAGVYGSVMLTENLSVDGSVLYGQSQNEAIATMFDQYFSGQFATERLLANLTLAGWWEHEALTVRPDIAMSLSTEDGGDYLVRNATGDAVIVEIDRQTEYRLGFGSAFEYRIDLGEPGTLTPKADFELGINGTLGGNATLDSHIFGRAMLGLDFTSGNGMTITGQVGTELDASGFRSVTLRGGLGASF